MAIGFQAIFAPSPQSLEHAQARTDSFFIMSYVINWHIMRSTF
jgi:hypothetical protein